MSKSRPASRLRIQFLALFMLLGIGSLGLRLWWIQVAHGAEWTAQIRGSSQATVRIPSVRGEIKDRNGITLVQNRASYEVDFYLPEMVKGYRERFGSPPTTEYRAIISGMPKDMKEPDIINIVTLTFGIGAACVGAAGVMLLLIFDVTPSVGPAYTLLAFVIVITGGLGSMPGALLGGVLIGVSEALAGFMVAPSMKSMFSFALLIAVLVLRPQGLMGKRRA